MRRLIYVPIIHTDADLGQMVEQIGERGRAVAGAAGWQAHKETVDRYWQQIVAFWDGKDVAGYKLFQDGMPVDGAVGERLVRTLAAQGSINHQLLASLIERGALLVKTEEPTLIAEEYTLTQQLLKQQSLPDNFTALLRYRQRKDALLRQRDRAIVKNIVNNLGEGETGVAFIGAYHQVWASLPQSITVIPLKDPAKVRAYYEKVTSRRQEDADTLAAYLVAPIDIDREINR